MIKKGVKIDYKYNLSNFYSIIKKSKWMSILLILIVIIMESTFIVDRLLFKSITDKGTNFASGALPKNEFITVLLIVLAIYVVNFIIRSASQWLSVHYLNIIESEAIKDLKKKFFEHIIRLSYRFHITHKRGSLISKITRGTGSIENMIDLVIFNFAPLIIQIVLVGISFIYFDLLSGIIVCSTIVIFITYSYFYQKKMEGPNMEANEKEDLEKGHLSDYISNTDTIKYFGKEKNISTAYHKFNKKTSEAYVKSWNYYRDLSFVQHLILDVGCLILIYFSITKLLNNEITMGTLVFIYASFTGIMGPMFRFVHGIRQFYRAMADFESLFKLEKIKNESEDKDGKEEADIKEGRIEFKNIYFKYNKRKLFSNFNLEIKPNEKVALVGHSGCGKTTLVRLLYRLYDVNDGSILIDGKDLKDFKKTSLRSELSIVPQEGTLFDDTIYNNVAFSDPKAPRSRIIRAIKFAHLDKIIKTFPKKENTIVGERGVKLSGGEKQRVSIARAILANKKILVLDEATSALDSKTEYDIQQGLNKLMKNRTTIIIAHRLSTIMKADKIVVIKKGKIVQMGKHDDLIEQEGEYKKLWNLQKGGYIE